MAQYNHAYRPNSTRPKDPKKQYQGAINKALGKRFEEKISESLRYYELGGYVAIEKTPEPMQLVKDLGAGRFIAQFTKDAQPDFKGTLRGGRSVVFEAKHTTSDRITADRVTDEQARRLDKHSAMGAICFVVVGFNMTDFFRVPWEDWKNFKALFGHKYATPAELEPYRIPINQKQILLIFTDNKR